MNNEIKGLTRNQVAGLLAEVSDLLITSIDEYIEINNQGTLGQCKYSDVEEVVNHEVVRVVMSLTEKLNKEGE